MNRFICRQKLAAIMAKRTGVFKKDCLKVIDAMVDEMVRSLKSNEEVYIPKLGRFGYKVRQETVRVDPVTREITKVPPATRVRFTPCRDLKYGVQALDWEPYVSERQKENAEWYKRFLERKQNTNQEDQ